MRLNKLSIHAVCATFVALSFVAQPQAKATSSAPATTASGVSSAIARIRIDNFGKVNPTFYRGAQPTGGDYADLATLGIRTVIDLTKDGREDEPGLVKRAGMQFFRIPMTTTDRPSDEAVAQFLKLVTDPANQPVFVHCQGGRHRTGTMTAVYRMTVEGWTADRAYAEMKQYKFEGFPGHPELKSFVYDYPAILASAQPAAKR